MYKEKIVVIRKGEIIITEEHTITSKTMLEILFNIHELINHPTEYNKILEYLRFGLNGCVVVNQCADDIIVVTIKEI